MKLIRGRTPAAIAAAIIATSVSGCAGAGVLPSPNVHHPGFGTNATGTVQLWVRAATQALSQPIVNKFNATHPRLKVVLTPIPDTQYVTKFATAIRGRSVPDLVDMDDINSTLLAYHDALTNITPLARKLPYLSKLSPTHLRLATLHGRMYAIPYAADVSVLYFNKTLFRKAGLDPNHPPTTLPAVLKDARAITKLGHGIKGISFGGDSPGIMGFTGLPSIWAEHVDLFRGPVGKQTANIAHNTPLRQWLQFYRTVWADGLAQPSSRTETGATWGKDFVAGKVGMWPGNLGALVADAIPKNVIKQVGAVPLPGARHGSCVFAGGDNIGIPRGAKNASGAWEYIKFALSKAQQSTMPAAGFTPVRRDVVTPQFVKKYPLDAVPARSLPHGYASKTLAYNTAVNQVSGGPFLQMFVTAVFGGNVEGAIKAAQPGFASALLEADS
jgi:multiple sugar transport system substrate-binding protein